LTTLRDGESWLEVISYTVTLTISWSAYSTITETQTFFDTIIGTAISVIDGVSTVIGIERGTFGVTRYSTVLMSEIHARYYVSILSRMIVRPRYVETPIEDTGLSTTMLLGVVSGGAAITCILIGIFVTLIRMGRAADHEVEVNQAEVRDTAGPPIVTETTRSREASSPSLLEEDGSHCADELSFDCLEPLQPDPEGEINFTPLYV
jgi:hypothetical protein